MEVSRDDFRELDRDVGKLQVKMGSVEAQLIALNKGMDTLVSKAEFFPVKAIAYGLAAGALGAVISAIISNVVIR